MADIQLKLFKVPVQFRDGTQAEARAEGIIAAWSCKCDGGLPLVGRAYFQFGHDCHTVCPTCNRRYRVFRDPQKRACRVEEI
jgi:hypothetical protein